MMGKLLTMVSPGLFATGVVVLMGFAYGYGRLHESKAHAEIAATLTAQLNEVNATNTKFKIDLDTQKKATKILTEEAIRQTQELSKVGKELEEKRKAARIAFAKTAAQAKPTGDILKDSEIATNVLRAAIKGVAK